MREILFILSIFTLTSSNCRQTKNNQERKETEDTLNKSVVVLTDDRQVESLLDIHDFPFSESEIACPFGNGLYGKFPLRQKWTTILFSSNQIITAETKENYYDQLSWNPVTSLAVQDKEFKSDFDIAFRGVYSNKDIEFMTLYKDNDTEIINLIKKNIPIDISVKEFYKKHNPKYEMSPFEITNVQPYSFSNNENKFWIAYCNFRFKEYETEYTGLIGVTVNKEVILLSGYCVYEEYSVILLRFKNELLLYVENDTCGEGAVVTTRFYKPSANFEKIFEETVGYD